MYCQKNQPASCIGLLNKGVEIMRTYTRENISPEEIVNLIKLLISYCFFLLSQTANAKLCGENYSSLQDLLSSLTELIKRFSPHNADISVIKGFWHFYNKEYNRATLYFAKALQRDPKKLAATLGLAFSNYYLGKYEFALKRFLRVAIMSKFKPEFDLGAGFDFRIGIALCQIGLGRHEAASLVLKQVIAKSPEKIEAYTLLAFIKLNQFKASDKHEERVSSYKEAYQVCMEALKVHSKHPALSLILSEVYFYARKYDEAYACSQLSYESSYATSSKLLCEACYVGAKIKYISGEDIEANKLLVQALNLCPNHEPSLVLQALLIFKDGDLEQTLRKLEGIIGQEKFEVTPQLFTSDIHLNLLYIILYSRLNRPGNTKDYKLTSPKFLTHIQAVKAHLGASEELSSVSRHNIFGALAEVALAYDRRQGWAGAEMAYKDTLSVYNTAPEVSSVDEDLAKCANNAAVAVLMHDNSFTKCQDFLDFALRKSEAIESREGSVLTFTILYNMAINLEKNNRIPEAMKKLEDLRAMHPSYFNATLKLGHLAQLGGDSNRAARLYREVIEAAGDSAIPQIRKCAADAYILLGSLQQAFRDLRAARHSFKMVLSKYNGNDFYALCAVGHNYYLVARQEPDNKQKAKLYHESALYFRKALQLEPKNPYPAAGVGCLLAAQGHYEIARKIFNQIGTSVEPVTFSTNYAHCCFRLARYQEAVESYAKVLKYCPKRIRFSILQGHARALYALGIESNNLRHIEHSIKQIREAIVLNPNDMTLVFDEAICLQKYCQIVCGKDPAEAGTYRIERSLSYLEEAKTRFEQLLTLRPEAMLGFNNQILLSRIGFSKTIHSSLLQRLEVAQAIEDAKPKKKLETYGLDMRASFELYRLTDYLPAEKEPEVPAPIDAFGQEQLSCKKPKIQGSLNPELPSDDGEEYDPSAVVACSSKM
ncbi:hypothetical protein DSO57_1017469 [Entomophthora muscae]|uniref:Uncharacterized protein n=1 Tax=Entomophthora muscae TaxID=34485 RepID=A0ACC2S6L8_9FUNG|nr:hypothetical protein DSO57_1017469 [Entomophthora muscae]